MGVCVRVRVPVWYSHVSTTVCMRERLSRHTKQASFHPHFDIVAVISLFLLKKTKKRKRKKSVVFWLLLEWQPCFANSAQQC